jgi:hypothetical protein
MRDPFALSGFTFGGIKAITVRARSSDVRHETCSEWCPMLTKRRSGARQWR